MFRDTLIFSLSRPRRRRNLNLSSLDIFLQLVQSRTFLNALPGFDTTVKHIVHFLQGFTLRFGRREEHVDECQAIERPEYHIHLPVADWRVVSSCFDPWGSGKKRREEGQGTYIFHNSGGTANAKQQFQNQLLAVAKETALALILVGKISDG